MSRLNQSIRLERSRREFLKYATAASAAIYCPRTISAQQRSGTPVPRGTYTCVEMHPTEPADIGASLRNSMQYGSKSPARNPLFSPTHDASADKPAVPAYVPTLSKPNLTKQELDTFQPQRLAMEKAKLWRKSELLWAFTSSPPNDLGDIIEGAFAEWQKNVGLELKRHDDHRTADIAIGFERSGFWSFVGTDSRLPELRYRNGGQSMNIEPTDDPEKFLRGVALHEIGHALGAIHEHQSPHAHIPWDVQALIKEYGPGTRNNWSIEQIHLQIINRYDSVLFNATKFDKTSIMKYPIKKEHLNQNDATWNSFVSDWNLVLSDLDQQFMRKSYPGASPPTTPPEKKDEEGSAIGSTISLPLNSSRSGAITRSGETVDYEISVVTSGEYVIETTDRDPATFVVLQLFNSRNSKQPALSDSLGGERLLNARLTVKLSAGKFYVRVKHRHYSGRGKYTISFREK